MSIEVFNGYIINKNISAYELNEIMNIIRKEVNLLYQQIIMKDFVDFVSKLLDNKYAMNKKEYASYITKELGFKRDDSLYKIFLDEIKNSVNNFEVINPHYDYSCNMTIHPLEDKILLRLFSPKNEYEKLFGTWDEKDEIFTKNKFDFIDEYIYHENKYIPNNLTTEEWNIRRDDWTKAIGKENPLDVGMKVEFINNDNLSDNIIFTNLEEEIKNIYDKRIKRTAKKYVNKKVIKNIGKSNEIYSFIESFNKAIQSSDYKRKILRAEEMFRDKLPLTYEVHSHNKLKSAKPIF